MGREGGVAAWLFCPPKIWGNPWCRATWPRFRARLVHAISRCALVSPLVITQGGRPWAYRSSNAGRAYSDANSEGTGGQEFKSPRADQSNQQVTFVLCASLYKLNRLSVPSSCGIGGLPLQKSRLRPGVWFTCLAKCSTMSGDCPVMAAVSASEHPASRRETTADLRRP